MIIKSTPPKRNFFMEVKNEEQKITPVKIKRTKSEDYTTDALVDEDDISDEDFEIDDEADDYTDEELDDSDFEIDDEAEDYTDDQDNEDTADGGNEEDTQTDTDTTDENPDDNATTVENEDDLDQELEDGPTDYSGEDSGENTQTDNQGVENPPEDETIDNPVEHLRKYNLYKELGNIFSVVKNMISRLENTSKDTIEGNLVINSVLDKLRTIEELIYQYLVIKFRTNTYIQSLYFYETIVASVNMTLKLMENNKDYIK